MLKGQFGHRNTENHETNRHTTGFSSKAKVSSCNLQTNSPKFIDGFCFCLDVNGMLTIGLLFRDDESSRQCKFNSDNIFILLG